MERLIRKLTLLAITMVMSGYALSANAETESDSVFVAPPVPPRPVAAAPT